MELEVHEARNDDDQGRRDDGRIDTWSVAWLVLRAEDGGSNDAADASSADERGRGEGTFPLAAKVIGLVGEDGGDVGVAGGGGEELVRVVLVTSLELTV